MMANLMQDMFRDIADRGVDKAQALKALRALSAWFGGQQLYIPQKKDGSDLAEEILGVMADAVGAGDAEHIYSIIAALYGGVQWYIPVEKNAFRDIISSEILKDYDGTAKSMRDLCRKYGISFSQVYRLYYEGFRKKRQREFDF